MGRWLKKLEDMPQLIPTELTKPSSVGFVGTNSTCSYKNKGEQLNLLGFVAQCCKGLNVSPQQVVEQLLSVDDELDIITGDLTTASLKTAIALWTAQGTPYRSGKKRG